MKTVTSIFLNHYNSLMDINDPQVLSEKILSIVKSSKIKDIDKRKIALQVDPLKENLSKLQTYLTNSMLQYQGMKVL